MKVRLRLVPRRVANIDCDRPEVTLWVRTRYGDFTRVRFIVDTAADFSALPIDLAQHEGIDFVQSEANRGMAAGLVGSAEKYLGTLTVRISGEEFQWPCDYLLPSAASASSQLVPGRARATPVLGRAGFLRAYAIRIDDDYLTIERSRGPRSWWRWIVDLLWSKGPREQSVIEPL